MISTKVRNETSNSIMSLLASSYKHCQISITDIVKPLLESYSHLPVPFDIACPC